MSLSTALKLALALAAAAFFGLYVWVAVARMGYPFALSWVEGSVLDHTARVLAGEELYVRPTWEFIPHPYTPLYLHLTAWVSHLLGATFLPGRLVSFLASLGCGAFVFAFIRRDGRSAHAALVGAGLFYATFALAAGYFDVARVDTLYLLLVLATFWMLRVGATARTAALAGAFGALAFMTKQSAITAFLPVVVTELVSRTRLGLWFTGTLVALGGACFLWWSARTDGWFEFYTFGLGDHGIHAWAWTGFWREDLLYKVPVLLVAGAGLLAAAAWTWRKRSLMDGRTLLFYLGMSAGLIGSAWASRLHVGGWLNILPPAYAMLSILTGILLGRLWQSLWQKSTAVQLLATALLGAQLWLGIYSPADHVPTRGDERAGNELLATIRAVEGDVLIMDQPYLARLAGKRGCCHTSALWDMLLAKDRPESKQLRRELEEAVRGKRFGAIFVYEVFQISDWQEFPFHYRIDKELFAEDDDRFFCVTGLPARPQLMWVPR